MISVMGLEQARNALGGINGQGDCGGTGAGASDGVKKSGGGSTWVSVHSSTAPNGLLGLDVDRIFLANPFNDKIHRTGTLFEIESGTESDAEMDQLIVLRALLKPADLEATPSLASPLQERASGGYRLRAGNRDGQGPANPSQTTSEPRNALAQFNELTAPKCPWT
ncbi:hypothetical protein BDK51DRAFT_27480 [Blyttiomyces helicus]|uniref:Uncharacterized protein n=1 Tax=Blyttiomyces helicus TaxID=388810 RepID=A0A4P9WMZ3_9FUNG|nr:hypothetical protein BDK51DRAFT_27480 [Blyttiomyces helicus]|eukprot:RKO93058.1 hypothetical protein BDK51DRAFT_27480 [Blyttiomyces helicus]